MSYVPPPAPPAASHLPAHGPVPNHLIWAIIATFFSLCLCCGIPGLGTGIAAIVFSSKVNSRLNAGDFDGARSASNTAKILCWVTTGFAILGLLWMVYSFTAGNGAAQWQEMMQQIQQAQ
ncbi:CD225/dispanin family protein [Pseudoxanthomonas koreensis]|uniref:CD225/dispanin family protein n=1 Tax=Pseudoxanthomonas koreensis TaxID=266061 RepID=UPI0035A70122